MAMSCKNPLWLDAFYDTSSQLKSRYGVVLLALADLANDGDDRLVAVLVDDQSQLRIFQGPYVQSDISLPQLVVAMCIFNMDESLPGIAVGAQSSLYIYKNFKPYYKYSIPHGGPKYSEETQITQLAALPRSEVSKLSLLLIGTEHSTLLIVDPQSYSAIVTIELAGIPALMKCSGYYDVEASIIIVTRESHVLLVRSKTQPTEAKTLLTLKNSVVDVLFNGSNVTLATSDRSIKCYTLQGQEIWKLTLTSFVLSMTCIEMQNQCISLMALSLANGQVLFFQNNTLVHQLNVTSNIIAMTSGRFGREDGVLIMVTKDGSLIVKILNRASKITPMAGEAGPPSVGQPNKKFALPAKNKIFVEQALREQRDSKSMYEQFEHGMNQMELRALREWHRFESSTEENPSVVPKSSIHLTPKLVGTGPSYRLQLVVRNTSKETFDVLHLVLHCTNGTFTCSPWSKKMAFLLPSCQRCLEFDIVDQSNRGGQLWLDVIEQIRHEGENGKSTIHHGHVLYSVKLDLTPSL